MAVFAMAYLKCSNECMVQGQGSAVIFLMYRAD